MSAIVSHEQFSRLRPLAAVRREKHVLEKDVSPVAASKLGLQCMFRLSAQRLGVKNTCLKKIEPGCCKQTRALGVRRGWRNAPQVELNFVVEAE